MTTPDPKIMYDENERYLRILSIAHYAHGVFVGLLAFLPIFHFGIGIAMLTGSFGPQSRDAGFPMQWFGLFFVCIAGGIMLMGWAYAVCSIIAGRYLQQRKNYTFCMVMGGVDCIFQPLGTVIGVFTLLLLTRAPVRALFDRAAAAPSAPTPA
jgi:hypothetical protein